MIRDCLLLIISIIFSYLISLWIYPLLKRLKCNQNVSRTLERHIIKNGTPTMGGLIFIIPFIILEIIFKINILLLIPSILYALLGFIDDFTKIKQKNNQGLSIIQKFLLELIIAIVFYFIYLINGYTNTLCIYNKCIDLNFFYGIWVLFMLVSFTNAVNITDGLDGLCVGLTIIFLLGFLIIIDIDNIISSVLIVIGSLLTFYVYNRYPAKIFMGDIGSLFLGAFMVCISFLIKKEYLLIIMGSVFIFEIFTSFIQVISIKFLHKKIFLKAPFHHHLEELNLSEKSIVRIFYLINIIMVLIGLLLEKLIIY